MTLVWQVEITSRQDPSIRPLKPLLPSPGPEGVVHCMCACDCACFCMSVKVSLWIYICQLKNYWLYVPSISATTGKTIWFMYVLNLFSINVCEGVCVFVCVCDYLLISEPTGANWGRMTMMRCVGMCPRVVLVWLSFCCFPTAPPSSHLTLFKYHALKFHK